MVVLWDASDENVILEIFAAPQPPFGIAVPPEAGNRENTAT